MSLQANLLNLHVAVERERRRRQATIQAALRVTPDVFLSRTSLKAPQDEGGGTLPFDLWPAQQNVLDAMQRERLLVILKARQLGISWLACGYVLWLCATQKGRTVLLFSQGQLEANELIVRIAFMAEHYQGTLPALVTENKSELAWANGSSVKSLPATKKAGRSLSASLIVLDEFAFMLFGAELYAAAKPTIDDGGKLWIISSADGQGTPYHQFWQAAQAGGNGFLPIFLPWQARPSRDPGWRTRKLSEAFADESEVLREYPENDVEAFTHAAGRIYDIWSDGPPDGNVTEAAEYIEGGGPVYWAVDDGYEGKLDPATNQYVSGSSPRVFLLIQERADGRICVFDEHYRVKVQQENHIEMVQALGYPHPSYAAMDSASADLRGRLNTADIYTYGKPNDIEESIKTTRRMLAPDPNGWRRILVHPRCHHLRWELASYQRDARTGKPIDDHNHGPDALRYFAHTKRLE